MAARDRLQQEHDRDMALAWNTAALTRGTKGLPKLDSLLSRPKARRQTQQEMAAMWQIIAARFGGTFTPMKGAS